MLENYLYKTISSRLANNSKNKTILVQFNDERRDEKIFVILFKNNKKIKPNLMKTKVKNQPRDKPHFAISSLNDRQKANDEKVIKTSEAKKLKEN